jgi:hypothetical protein
VYSDDVFSAEPQISDAGVICGHINIKNEILAGDLFLCTEAAKTRPFVQGKTVVCLDNRIILYPTD